MDIWGFWGLAHGVFSEFAAVYQYVQEFHFKLFSRRSLVCPKYFHEVSSFHFSKLLCM
jgi:hypothetical protein